ncbi:MAG: tyrosine-type recombinase/integrase [Gammaproteobacteria bacterium]
MQKLNDTRLRSLKQSAKAYKIADGGGLYLELRPTGARVWRYRFRFEHKPSVITLGEYPTLGLQEARARHEQARKQVRDGIHPGHQRRADRFRKTSERTNTFESVAREWIRERLTLRSSSYRRQVLRSLERHLFPRLGSRPVREVTPAELLDALKQVEKAEKAAMAKMLRQWASAVFRFAAATLRAEHDPAAVLRDALTSHKVTHVRALTLKDVPAFLSALNSGSGCERPMAIFFNLLLLLFPRPSELRCARWSEFDLGTGIWTVPSERMKKREQHTVPLSAQAIALLKELLTLTGGREHLFPNRHKPAIPMAIMSARCTLMRLGWGDRLSPHGFRATASTALNEQGWRPDVIERQLAHRERNATRAAYNRAQYLPERQQMMQAWANVLDSLTGGNVVPIIRRQA